MIDISNSKLCRYATNICFLFSKKLRVNIDVPLKIEQKADEEAIESIEAHIAENRKLVIQALIIRLMKMIKTLKHQQLVAEVLSQLRVNFNPKISMIEVRI